MPILTMIVVSTGIMFFILIDTLIKIRFLTELSKRACKTVTIRKVSMTPKSNIPSGTIKPRKIEDPFTRQ